MFAPSAQTLRRTAPWRAMAIGAAVVASAAGLAACGSSHRTAAPASRPDTIVIKNFAFHPLTLVVSPGATVTVDNQDSATHTLTASGSAKPFDTGNIAGGAVATFTAPSQPGSYRYICQMHQFMSGTLTVR